MVGTLLTDDEFSSILEDFSKRIEGDITWVEDKNHLPAWTFSVLVESEAGWPLSVNGSYNPRTRRLSYALILQTEGRIYGLDMGKRHRNPRGEQVGRKHKHRWSERYRDKVAYTPNDITASAADPAAVWREFCAEAQIQHNGNLRRR